MKKSLTFISFLLFFTITIQRMLYAQDGDVLDKIPFNIAGFMTADYVDYAYHSDDILGAMMPEHGAFSQTSLNLYFTFINAKSWKGFCDIRFLYYPGGKKFYIPPDEGVVPEQLTVYPFDNKALDRAFVNTEYGSISIERAYIEWNRYDRVNVRFGRFFTPFGIWNQNHAAPAFISCRSPFLVQAPLPDHWGMPQTQTGVEMLGSIPISDFCVNYALYAGNGMSDASATSDEYDKNKSAGCFVNLTMPTIAGIIDIEFGASGYRGQRTAILYTKYDFGYAAGTVDDISVGAPYYGYNPANHRFISKQMDTFGLAHLCVSVQSLPFDGIFTLQAEGLRQWADMDNDNRIVDRLGQETTPVDYTYDVYYVQADYQLFEMITPFFRYEKLQSDTRLFQDLLLASSIDTYAMGINFKPALTIAIKADYYIVRAHGPFQKEAAYQILKINNSLEAWALSISMAF